MLSGLIGTFATTGDFYCTCASMSHTANPALSDMWGRDHHNFDLTLR